MAAQRCFCRQRSYQRDHARSRPIAEAKPVWARSVLPWVTRWESRVMLLFLFLFALQQPSLFLLYFFLLISSSHAHARSLLDLVGWLVHLAGCSSLPPHPQTLSSFLFGRVCSSCCCLHWRALCTHTEGWLAGEHTGTQSTHHHDADGMRCHT